MAFAVVIDHIAGHRERRRAARFSDLSRFDGAATSVRLASSVAWSLA